MCCVVQHAGPWLAGDDAAMDRLRRWRDGLGARLLLSGAIAVALGALLVVLTVRWAVTPTLVGLQEGLAETSAVAVAAHIESTVSTAEALCRAMADAVAATPDSDLQDLHRLVRGQFDHLQYDAVIAGGGVWPEPGALSPGLERAAVFYSRDEHGRLAPFQGYNEAGSPPYQRAEWYAPVHVLARGACAWSRAYRDPHSRVPMVTCTVPVWRDGRLWGAATVDVRLDGLAAFCAANRPAGSGYLAVFDRELRPMTLPADTQAGLPTAAVLAAGDPRWRAPAAALHELASARADGPGVVAMAGRLAGVSDELDAAQARRLAAVLTAPPPPPRRAAWERDPLLGGAATAFISVLPGSGWTVLAAVPSTVPQSAAAGVATRVAGVVALPALLALGLLMLGAHLLVVRPLGAMTARLQAAGDDPSARVGVGGPGEIGQLAAALDRRAERLERAQAERAEARDALAASEERLRQVLAGLAEPVVRCSAAGAVTYANPAWARMVGRAEADCPGQNLYADISAEDWDRLRATVAGMAAERASAACECRLAAPGGVRWVAWSITGVFAGPRLEEFQLVGRDITRAREAEAAADRARRRLARADRLAAIGLLTSAVAHEVSNPNQVVTMNAQLLERVLADLDPELARLAGEGRSLGGLPAAVVRDSAPRLLAGISASAARIAAIVGDLRSFARSDAADQAVDLDAVAAAAAGLLAHQLAPGRCRFAFVRGPGLPPVRGDARRLEQVAANLLLNAVQALTDPGQTVELATGQRDGRVFLSVADGGRGIPPGLLPRLGEPFATTRPEGLGLGLWISAGIVRGCGGSLAFAARPGGGTVATVELPALPGAEGGHAGT